MHGNRGRINVRIFNGIEALISRVAKDPSSGHSFLKVVASNRWKLGHCPVQEMVVSGSEDAQVMTGDIAGAKTRNLKSGMKQLKNIEEY